MVMIQKDVQNQNRQDRDSRIHVAGTQTGMFRSVTGTSTKMDRILR